MKLPEKEMLKNIDYPFVLALLAILGLSIAVMPSAAAAVSGATDHAALHMRFILGGLVVMLFVLAVDYSQWQSYSKYLYVFTIMMLFLVIFSGLGGGGVQRWMEIGSFRFQPSELAKLLTIIAFADFLTKRQGKLENLKQFLPCFVFIGVPTLLIFMQPDLGTALVFIAILFGMMFIAGANVKLLVGLFTGGLAAAIGVIYAHVRLLAEFDRGILPLRDYQIDRLTSFLDPHADPAGAGFHIIQSQIAIGSGGLTGQGLFQGPQTHLNFIPEHHTDFIFSVVGEELGFIGAVIILVLYFFLIYRCINIMAQAKDMFGILIVAGITSMLLFHILVNVGMTIGIMPITGIPLPLFSYGGTSMITNLLALGIVLSIGMRRKKLTF